MALRLLEAIIPEGTDDLDEIREQFPNLELWHEALDSGETLVRLLVSAEKSETLLEYFEQRFSHKEGFRIILLAVEATVPRVEEKEETQEQKEGKTPQQPEEEKPRISREEIYEKISQMISLSGVYVTLVVLASIVAGIGLLRNNVPIIIGAMVIAPSFGPNVALALATTLGDAPLAKKGLKTNLLFIVVGLIIAMGMGMLMTVDPKTPEIASRSTVNVSDITLALASGAAGALSLVRGISGTLIGVVIAAALLPPLIASGLLFGAGYLPEALSALLLLAVNLIAINLAGVLTFILHGVHPLRWWKAQRAREITWFMIALWSLLLAALFLLITFGQ